MTVYVAMTLGVIISLCLALIEGVRSNAIRMEAVCICDVAQNSVLAEYHRQLWEQYNLFYVDTSYGTQYVSGQNTKDRMQYYLDKNVNYEEIQVVDMLYKDFLQISFENVKLLDMHMATDGNGAVFRKSAIEAVKDDFSITQVETLLEWIGLVEGSGYLEENMDEQAEEIHSAIEQCRQNSLINNLDKTSVVEVENPIDYVRNMKAKGLLSLCLPDKSVSATEIDPEAYVSKRREYPEHFYTGTYVGEESLGITDHILLREYFLRYSGRYGEEKPNSLLKYQTEYVIAGKAVDSENLSSVTGRILAIREAANVAYIYGSNEMMSVSKIIGVGLASALLMPEAADLFTTAVVLVWGFLESVYDVNQLLSGDKIPFMKDRASWHTDLGGLWSSENSASGAISQQGYEDYLRIFLYLTDTEIATYRFMDLCEMDIRLTCGNEAFRMDACSCEMEMAMDVVSKFGYRYSLERKIHY